MQCHNCRSQLPEGVVFCQQCGAPQSPPPPPSSIAPTVAAPQPSYNNFGPEANYNQSTLDPTVMASPPSPGNPTPYTNYNPSSVPGSGSPYEGVQNPYSNVPYGQSQPGSMSPYGQSQPGNVPPYAPNNMPPYTSPSPGQMPSYGSGVPPFASPPPAKPKSKVGLIVGIVIVVLLFACIGSGLLFSKLSPTPTPTTGTTPQSTPTADTILSGNTVDTTASSIITNIQMASDVNTDTAEPKTLAKSFQTGDTVYVAFQIDFRNTDVNQQNPGYTQAKYYTGNTLYHTTKSLTIDDSVAPSGQSYAYFGYPYDNATDGAVEVYWCRTSDCSDGKLAGTATFTIN